MCAHPPQGRGREPHTRKAPAEAGASGKDSLNSDSLSAHLVGVSIPPGRVAPTWRRHLAAGELDGFAHPEIVLVIGLVELAVFEAKRLGITKVALRLFLLVVPVFLQVLA